MNWWLIFGLILLWPWVAFSLLFFIVFHPSGFYEYLSGVIGLFGIAFFIDLIEIVIVGVLLK